MMKTNIAKSIPTRFRTVAALAVAGAMTLIAADAAAAIALIKTTSADQSGAGTDSFSPPIYVDFNGPEAGGTEYTFTATAANQNILISFRAECRGGPNPFNPDYGSNPSGGVEYADYVWVRIQVGPAGSTGWTTVSPTRKYPNLCTGPETTYAGLDARYTSAVAGTYKIRVQVGSYLGGWNLGPKSLVVER